MSWAEVIKVNNNLSTPINIANLINYIDLVGNSYVGTDDIETTVDLLKYDILNAHNKAMYVVGDKFWDYISATSANAGDFINKAFKLNDATLSSYQTLSTFMSGASDATLFKLGKNFTFLNSFRGNGSASSIFASMITPPLVAGMFADSEIINFMHSELYNISTFLPIKQIRENATNFTYMNGSTFLAKLTTTGAGTYTVPANVYNLTVMCVSGGGGGGASDAAYASGIGGTGGGGGGVGGSAGIGYSGTGGGAGSYKVYSIAVTPGQEIGYYVGAGGAGGTYTSINGSNGEASYFGIVGQSAGYKYKSSQNYTFPTLSTGGAQYDTPDYTPIRADGGGGDGTSSIRTYSTSPNSYGGAGGGGFGGGNGETTIAGNAFDGYSHGGVGSGTWGSGGGGGYGSHTSGSSSGSGGGGYGGGGGGTYVNAACVGGTGGQGIIGLYLGYNQFTE